MVTRLVRDVGSFWRKPEKDGMPTFRLHFDSGGCGFAQQLE